MKFFKIIEKSEKYLAVSKKMSNFAVANAIGV
jgi:hypothetical protein